MVIRWYSAPLTGLSTCGWLLQWKGTLHRLSAPAVSRGCKVIKLHLQQRQGYMAAMTTQAALHNNPARLEKVEGGAAQGRVVPPPTAPPRMPHQAAQVAADCRQGQGKEGGRSVGAAAQQASLLAAQLAVHCKLQRPFSSQAIPPIPPSPTAAHWRSCR